MKNEKELDFLEKHIPILAESAVKKAYFDALTNGEAVFKTIGDDIYIIS